MTSERQIERAARELQKRLEPWVSMADLPAFCRSFIDAMVANDWRHIPPPPPVAGHRNADPDTAHRGAEHVRQTMGYTKEDQ